MEKEKIYVTARCPIRTTLELVGGKWRLLIIQQLLSSEALRLSELKRMIPDISEKMLIQELQSLTESKLVKRHDYNEKPPKVEYSITDSGRKVKSLIEQMAEFAGEYEKMLADENED